MVPASESGNGSGIQRLGSGQRECYYSFPDTTARDEEQLVEVRTIHLALSARASAEQSIARPRLAAKQSSLEWREIPAVELPGSYDVKLQRVERGEVGVVEDVLHIFQGEHFPVVQADEDVATLNAGLVGGA